MSAWNDLDPLGELSKEELQWLLEAHAMMVPEQERFRAKIERKLNRGVELTLQEQDYFCENM